MKKSKAALQRTGKLYEMEVITKGYERLLPAHND